MASPRAEGDLVIGYDLGEGPSYSAFVLMRRHEDGTLEVLESENVPGPITRGQLLRLCLDAIMRHRPRVLSVRVGNGQAICISQQTVEEVLAGTKEWNDLMIGS